MSASAPVSASPARRPRARLLAATLVTIAALTLTACEDGHGLRDEGPSTPTSPTPTSPTPTSPTPTSPTPTSPTATTPGTPSPSDTP
ncbi:hypothetical protein IM697_41745 [Streptomyces ferrugineus]|uniref:Uncharacterized protein n=1 Tax=Streptomyces ferrugineus TaxID=1413221 RepID=A0A7M2SJC4_9ACTN|nr:hypothetical protein [Streptomyces ferrugineus]QOV36446.1 hypothetical protein IM697_41745 [Streptomyces ferrugineus]